VYAELAKYYDTIYSFKDYQAEAESLTALVRVHLHTKGMRLLDVACGTGSHLQHLKEHFQVEGLDVSPQMVELARRKLPDVPLHVADMADFDLGRRFDVVTCLFSSIGYLKTIERVRQALACLASHVLPGGLLIVEPWLTPETWKPGTVHALFIDEPEYKLARINTSFVDGCISYFDLHYLIGTPEGTTHWVEHHELGLFTSDEMREAMAAAGLDVSHEEEGLTGRGLWVGRKP
jgi:ubiquinone/menaquinone biosynthesis C-methylase UbiE